MFNVFGLKKAKLDKTYLMRRKSQSAETYWDFIREVGAPNKTITDNAKEFLSKDWQQVNRLNCILNGSLEAFHQNQNYAERRGDDIKTGVLKLFYHTLMRLCITRVLP